MSGCLANTAFAAAVRCVSTEVPGTPVMMHDVALAAQLVDQPLRRDPAGLLLIDMRVVGARLGDLGVISENDHALVAGVLHHLIERRRRDRINHDRLRALLDHRIDLLDLPLRVGSSDLHGQVHLVAKRCVVGHGLDHVRRLGLPVIADIAHAEEDFELVRSLCGDPGGRQECGSKRGGADDTRR